MRNTITNQDILDGIALSEFFSTLSEEGKNQVLIYISALRDREMLLNCSSGTERG